MGVTIREKEKGGGCLKIGAATMEAHLSGVSHCPSTGKCGLFHPINRLHRQFSKPSSLQQPPAWLPRLST
jgi:hypothetical protein